MQPDSQDRWNTPYEGNLVMRIEASHGLFLNGGIELTITLHERQTLLKPPLINQ